MVDKLSPLLPGGGRLEGGRTGLDRVVDGMGPVTVWPLRSCPTRQEQLRNARLTAAHTVVASLNAIA